MPKAVNIANATLPRVPVFVWSLSGWAKSHCHVFSIALRSKGLRLQNSSKYLVVKAWLHHAPSGKCFHRWPGLHTVAHYLDAWLSLRDSSCFVGPPRNCFLAGHINQPPATNLHTGLSEQKNTFTELLEHPREPRGNRKNHSGKRKRHRNKTHQNGNNKHYTLHCLALHGVASQHIALHCIGIVLH